MGARCLSCQVTELGWEDPSKWCRGRNGRREAGKENTAGDQRGAAKDSREGWGAREGKTGRRNTGVRRERQEKEEPEGHVEEGSRLHFLFLSFHAAPASQQ